MKNYIAVTDGAGFVGSNLIKLLLNKTKYQTIVWMIIVQVQKKSY